ncbi:hypothetical protein LZ31DRAFT_298778, partial [Colletotrichum somersetense]
ALTIILCFIAANAANYILLPWNVVSKTDNVAVTAINRLIGSGFGIAAAVLICLVVAGSAGQLVRREPHDGGRSQLQLAPRSEDNRPAANSTDELPSSLPRKGKSESPLNAHLLSTMLSALYILFDNSRALLTFNGLGEYTFFLTVLGAVVLRVREPKLRRPYKPLVLIPVVFALVSGFVVVRGAIFAPVQALILIVLWLVGLGFLGQEEVLRAPHPSQVKARLSLNSDADHHQL